MSPELRPPSLDPTCVLQCGVIQAVPWLIGLFIWLATRRLEAREELRARTAWSAAALGALWFIVGLLAKIDWRSRDLFVYVGLSVMACVLVDFAARWGQALRNYRSWVLMAAGAGTAIIPVLRAWPPSGYSMHGDGVATAVAAILPSKWLPWCSQQLFDVATAGGAASSSAAVALAVIARRSSGDGGAARFVRVGAGMGIVGAAIFLALHVIVSAETCVARDCG
jgi:hypothetical protein